MMTSPKFKRLPSVSVSSDVVAQCFLNISPRWPVMTRYDIPDFMYSQVKFESRPNKQQLTRSGVPQLEFIPRARV